MQEIYYEKYRTNYVFVQKNNNTRKCCNFALFFLFYLFQYVITCFVRMASIKIYSVAKKQQNHTEKVW